MSKKSVTKSLNVGGKDVTESRRVLEDAFDVGILAHSRRISSAVLPPSKLLLRASGKDIVKKSTARRSRYLLVFNCQVAPAAAGKLGTLAQLDSKNPVMYIDFPQGRLKLCGTLVFPHNKYLILKLGQKDVLCEDVLDSLIVFSKVFWVGSSEENPDENELPLPHDLSDVALHECGKYHFTPSVEAVEPPEEEEDQEDDVYHGSQGAETLPKAHRSKRFKRGFCNSECSDGDKDRPLKKVSKTTSATDNKVGSLVDLTDEGRPSAQGSQGMVLKPSQEVVDLLEEDEEDCQRYGEGRVRRAAASMASKKLKVESDSEEDTGSATSMDEEGSPEESDEE